MNKVITLPSSKHRVPQAHCHRQWTWVNSSLHPNIKGSIKSWNTPPTKHFKNLHSAGKVVLTFWDAHCILLEFLDHSNNENILLLNTAALDGSLKHFGLLTEKVILLQHHAPPPYCFDLALSNFFFNPLRSM